MAYKPRNCRPVKPDKGDDAHRQGKDQPGRTAASWWMLAAWLVLSCFFTAVVVATGIAR